MEESKEKKYHTLNRARHSVRCCSQNKFPLNWNAIGVYTVCWMFSFRAEVLHFNEIGWGKPNIFIQRFAKVNAMSIPTRQHYTVTQSDFFFFKQQLCLFLINLSWFILIEIIFINNILCVCPLNDAKRGT